jgi:hypothetical protein
MKNDPTKIISLQVCEKRDPMLRLTRIRIILFCTGTKKQKEKNSLPMCGISFIFFKVKIYILR